MSHYRRRQSALRGLVVALALGFAFSCSSGSGCSGCGMQPIPGGFPATKRTANAGQVRVTSSAITKITADPGQLLAGLLGGSGSAVISFPVESCGSTSVCCNGSTAIPNCGPVDIDLSQHAGDLPRLVLAPQNTASPNGEVEVTVRARVKTVDPLQVTIAGLLTCDVTLDTTQGSSTDLVITAPLDLDQDATAGTTKFS